MLLHEQPAAQPAPDPELLIEEARRRGRRRRLAVAAAALIVGGAAMLALLYGRSGGAAARTAQPAPKGVFANSRAFAGHGLLAFVSRGRLFVLDGRTGKLTAVTSPGQHASTPQFSPGGRWLAYALGSGKPGLARADGTGAHRIAGGGAWLPNGDLLARDGVYRVDGNGRPVRLGAAPPGLAAWSPDGDRFAFLSRSVKHEQDGAFHGVERLQVADSLTGRRTTWLSHPISFTRKSGFAGYAINGIDVLPHREGILYWADPMQSASLAADGMSVYELRSPGARPVELGVTVGDAVSAGPAGKLALGAGGDRYAWISKRVETCNVSRARCTSIALPPGRLALDPAWSPDGRTLAFVGAAAEPEGAFSQPMLDRWYATHHLWLLHAGTSRPTEIAGTMGAASPTWSADGKSLLYVANDALWLIPSIGTKPVKVAGPLFPPRAWPSYYGKVAWADQFAWSSR